MQKTDCGVRLLTRGAEIVYLKLLPRFASHRASRTATVIFRLQSVALEAYASAMMLLSPS